MPKISFFQEDIDFVFTKEDKIKHWISQTIQKENKTFSSINIIFCSDEYLLKINSDYLNHKYYTDIITFPYHNQEISNNIEGDIFISISRVEENAKKYFTTFANELHRVIIHGILHLIGYLDSTKDQKEVMTTKENHYLQYIK